MSEMYALLKRLFPICRSLTGDGVRLTLAIIREELPNLTVHEIPSGTRAFDWTVPDEWNIKGARLTGPNGETVVDFADHNLHVVGYSEPVDLDISLDDLREHLHSRPDLPDAIPYITSYYRRRWGFCLPHAVREALKPGRYHARIDSTLEPGGLTCGELIIPGKTEREVLLSTYVCHPSLANNELSGPVVAVELAKWILAEPRRHTYRLVFVPETIGAIVYLSKNLETMRRNTDAGFVLTCLGDERAYSYVPSRKGGTLADRAALRVLEHCAPDFIRYTFLNRGSDERQYCSPGVDLPVCSVMRSKYGAYPEYHTSLDNLDLVTERGLQDGFAVMRKCLEALEANRVYRCAGLCEPNLGKRGLYSTLGAEARATAPAVRDVMKKLDVLAYADGSNDLLDLAEHTGMSVSECSATAKALFEHGLLRETP
jgi:aminopeptidase-like protein